jgi:transposase InsO family protein
VEQRIGLLSEVDAGRLSVAAACRTFGVSRATYYYWLARRASGDPDWFLDRSHAALSCPHQTGAIVAGRVIEVRRRFPHFGPKKIRAWLMRREPMVLWPAASTIGDILEREGLTIRRRRRRRGLESGQVRGDPVTPGQEWCCDFKGWFRTADGRRCDPLTVSDSASRYLIAAQIVSPTTGGVQPVFEALFAEHGLPEAIRCDNGPPFGAPAPGGLSRLSVWWLKLGVRPHFIRPASPQDNACHERMHRTLKAQTAQPPAANPVEQQQRLNAFRDHFNNERPHEALAQRPPVELWRAPQRPMPHRLITAQYGDDHQVRAVRSNGEIKWRGQLVFIGPAFVGEPVGLAPLDNDDHIVRFFDIDLGVIDRRGQFVRFAPLRQRLREAHEPPPSEL